MDINDSTYIDSFYAEAKKLNLKCIPREKLYNAISKLVTSFLKERNFSKRKTELISLSDKGRAELISLLMGLYCDIQRLSPTTKLSNKRIKFGAAPVIRNELDKIREALNFSEETFRELYASMYDEGDKDMSPMQRCNELQFSVNIIERAIDITVQRLKEQRAAKATPWELRPNNVYFMGAISAYNETILKENPKAGVSNNEGMSFPLLKQGA